MQNIPSDIIKCEVKLLGFFWVLNADMACLCPPYNFNSLTFVTQLIQKVPTRFRQHVSHLGSLPLFHWVRCCCWWDCITLVNVARAEVKKKNTNKKQQKKTFHIILCSWLLVCYKQCSSVHSEVYHFKH